MIREFVNISMIREFVNGRGFNSAVQVVLFLAYYFHSAERSVKKTSQKVFNIYIYALLVYTKLIWI